MNGTTGCDPRGTPGRDLAMRQLRRDQRHPEPSAADPAATMDLHEFAGYVRHSSHVLNNVLTALSCQWDLACPPAGTSSHEPARDDVSLLLRRASEEVLRLAAACAAVSGQSVAEGSSRENRPCRPVQSE